MLSRASESIGLEWRPPLCPEHSRQNEWYLGMLHADHQRPPPVPFFLERHKEVSFSAQNRASTASTPTTLDGGAAKVYMEIPLVKHAIVMLL